MSSRRPKPPPGTEPGDVLTLDESAAYLRVPADELRRLAEEKAVPGRKIGEEWRFLKQGLQHWLSREPAAEEQRRYGPEYFAVEWLLEELERRWQQRKASLDQAAPKPGSKARILELAGAWKDDPTLGDMLRDIYARRGRPETEAGE